MTTTAMPEKVHHGRAVKRLRELLQVKQETLANALGLSQQTVSLLETKETIEPSTLEQIAKVLNIPVDAIKNYNEESVIYNIQNNYEGSNVKANIEASNVGSAYHCTFHPLDKYIDAMEENKKLYERLLKEKDEKIALLEKVLDRK